MFLYKSLSNKSILILDKSRNFKLICIKCKINSDLSSYISFSHFLVTLESSAISNFVVQYHNFMRKYHNFVVQYYHFVLQCFSFLLMVVVKNNVIFMFVILLYEVVLFLLFTARTSHDVFLFLPHLWPEP